MQFEISHVTEYEYDNPAAEAYVEARLTAPDTEAQTIHEHRIVLNPETATSAFDDYFGNRVEFLSLPYRHTSLKIENRMLVTTRTVVPPAEALELCVQESRQIFSSMLGEVFDWLQPTSIVSLGRESSQWARRYLNGGRLLREALPALNTAIHQQFIYKSGSTTLSTPVTTVWKQKRGVCQDFAHVMLAVLRTAGLPARYVCGYIETEPPPTVDGARPRRLIGAVATHAWVEVLLPGRTWVGLDPTNNKWCGEQHVAVSYGRDFSDASPVRGTFKGTGGQRMKIRVIMKRASTATKRPLPVVGLA